MGVGCSFYMKNKLKSKIFHDKKSLYTKTFFFFITKGLNYLNDDILTNNLVTFKRWDGTKNERMKNCNMGVHWKI